MKKNIYGYKCKKCGHLHYPYRMVCKNCKKNEHNEFTPVPLPKTGKLLTFTTVYNLPAEFETPSLDLGIVELENGIRITGQLEIEKPKIGMSVVGEVAAVKHDQYDTFHGMIFKKA